MQRKMRGSIEDDIIGISKQKKLKKPTSTNKKTTTKGKVDVGLQKALMNKKSKIAKDSDSKARISLRARKEKFDIDQAYKRNEAANKNKTGKVKATAGNTKNFASTMATQKKLIKMGAKIKADGIMGSKTRAAMAKFMKPGALPKSRPTKNSGVSQGSTIAKDRGKTGFGTSAMNTKGSSKPAEKRAKKKYGLSLTELQKKRARRDNRRKMIGST